jgi:maltose-binding protein MalE
LTFRMLVLATAFAALGLTFTACEAGSSKLLIVPSAVKYTKALEVRKFVIQVEGTAKVKILNEVITKSQFHLANNCLGEVVQEGTPCTEEIELTTFTAGLSAEFIVTPQVGVQAVAKLTT